MSSTDRSAQHPTEEPLEPDLAFAHQLADVADAITIAAFERAEHAVEIKTDRSPGDTSGPRNRSGTTRCDRTRRTR
jgi:hypothetical protein